MDPARKTETAPRYYDVTRSTCPECRALVLARTVARNGKIYLETHCPEHGMTRALVTSDEAYHLDAQAYCKPGTLPREFHSEVARGCPEDCGFCPDHEQHVCMPVIEITDHCNMKCPICLVQTPGTHEMSLDALKRIVERLLAAEGTIQVLNLSGGEPTLHSRYREFLEYLTGIDEILRVSVSTNGLVLDRDAELRALHKELDVVISLQFDGFSEDVYEGLRGRRNYAPVKRRLIERMAEEDLVASLTVTLARGVNEKEMPAILEAYLQHDNLISITIQPFSHEGQGRSFTHDPLERITIPDVIQLIAGASKGLLEPRDFTPLPCSHPTCFSLTFLLKLEGGGWIPVKRLLEVDEYLDLIRNRSYISPDGENVERMRNLVYELWSGPAASIPQSDAALKTIKGILREIDSDRSPSNRSTVRIAERRMKSIFIHQFMDAETFDLSRVRRCCSVYPKEDGKIYPMCVYNVLKR